MVVCIFIASSTSSLSPLATLAPTPTASDVMSPGIGRGDLRWNRGIGFRATFDLRLHHCDPEPSSGRDMPLSSKSTVRLPSRSTAPMLIRRMNNVLPSSMATEISLARFQAVEKNLRREHRKIAEIGADTSRTGRRPRDTSKWL